MRTAAVLGSGVAALCSALILARHGWRVDLHDGDSSAGPRLVLNATTVQLVNQLFGENIALWPEAHALRGRYVRWDAAAGERFFGEPATVISSQVLGRRLRERVLGTTDRIAVASAGAEKGRAEPLAGDRWVIAARGRSAAGSGYRNWLRRCVLSADVACDAATSSAFTEATTDGWLFLFPHAPGMATLQAMVADVAADPAAQIAAMLAETTLIAPRLRETPRTATVARAAPRLRDDLCRSGWIAVGNEALSLDPLCGDGTGHALREAILAAAVVRWIEDGLPAAEALDHYRNRLQRTLAAHLRACAAFYGEVRFAGAWDAEIAAMEKGTRDLERSVAARPEAALRIRGFDLTAADAARL
jgi:hypothetical protein